MPPACVHPSAVHSSRSSWTSTPSVSAYSAAGSLLLVIILIVIAVRAAAGRRSEAARASDLERRLRGKEEEHSKLGASKQDLERRFAAVLDADAEAARVRAEASAETAKQLATSEGLKSNIEGRRSQYAEKKTIFDSLARQAAIFDERIAFAEMGVYEPHFDFNDSDQYKAEIEDIRAEQKATVSAKTAVTCSVAWKVEGSEAKGRTMIDRAVCLALRAFNNECDAAIANVRWSNANAMEKRIETARPQIDKMNAPIQVVMSERYLRLKLKELRLTHEYREKQKAEREERAELARAAREEQKLQRDLELAEQEEARYARLLAKAKEAAEGAVGPKLESYAAQIEALERDLAEAHAKAERAQAMAERTKTGYVYIISNVGSFGPKTVKIGLTRRLDPEDRIRELGDASVPFVFDTHAIIYSDDAPALERALHNEFAATRVNAKNLRKEFFRAAIPDVEAAVRRLAPAAPFFSDVEAQEYQETLAMRKAVLQSQSAHEALAFPATI